MTLRELKAEIDELCERDPRTAIALARRIHNKLQPGFPTPLRELHQYMVQQSLLGLPSTVDLEFLAQRLRDQGWEEADIHGAIERMKQPGLQEGMGFGGLHLEDLITYAEALWRQGTGKFTLEVEFENPDDDHLTLTIVKLSRAHWQEHG